MKKLISLLFSLFLLSPVCAEGQSIVVPSSTVRVALSAYFSNDTDRAEALTAYRDFVVQNGGAGIQAEQVWKVCQAGGLDIKGAGRAQCEKFMLALNENYKSVCQNGASDAGCLKVFEWTQVTHRQGVGLAQAYAKYNKDDIIACSNEEPRHSWNDDYLSCRSVLNTNVYYEFQFDDLEEPKDETIKNAMQQAICIIAGQQFHLKPIISSTQGSSAGASSTGYSGPNNCYKHTVIGPQAEQACERVKLVAKEFGYTMSYDAPTGRCHFLGDGLVTSNYLVNEYDGIIDNFVYSSGKDQTQLQAMPSLDESIEQYCQTRLAPTKITSFKCDPNHQRLVRGLFEDREDVLTCHINGKRVDFVFDDLAQSRALWGQKIIDGSEQALGCRASGGIYDGEHCADLTEDGCKQVAKLNAKECPWCTAAYWDTNKEICMLPASAAAEGTKAIIRVVSGTGVAIAGVAITVATGGTTIMVTAASVAAAASAVSDGVSYLMDLDASDWVAEMNRVQTPEEADAFLHTHLSEIMGADSLTAPRRNGLDEMLSRVLHDASPEYFQKIVEGCYDEGVDGDAIYNNTLSTCMLNPDNGRNTKETIIQIADTVQFIAGIVMAVEGLRQTATTVSTRVENISDEIETLKTTGWIRQNGRWFHQTTNEWVDVLPDNVPGWDPMSGARSGGRWRGHLYGRGTPGSFTKLENVVRYVTENAQVITAVANPNYAVAAAGLANAAAAGHSMTDKNYANVQLPSQQTSGAVSGGQTSAPAANGYVDNTSNTGVSNTGATNTDNANAGAENTGATNTDNANAGAGNTGATNTDNADAGAENTGATNTDTSDAGTTNTGTLTVPAETETSRYIATHKVSGKRKSAAGAIAAIAGVAAAGGLIGGLIVAGDNRDKKSSSAPTAPVVPADLDRVMATAIGSFATDDGQEIRLVSLPTTDGTAAPIVSIDGRAVVVVDYRGKNLPYYLDARTRSWAPLLGIGEKGGWFNIYAEPNNTGIRVIDNIRKTLDQQIVPSVVLRYIAVTGSGVRFPVAASGAYAIINRLFINGVVQTNNGAMDPASQTLYINNYNMIRELLK